MTSCVLAIESGGATASVALIEPTGQLRVACAQAGQSHSSRLLPLAHELLQQAGLSWNELDGIVVGVGPGSFTGLRMACGVAQGLALGAQKRLLPISGFEAWSYAWWQLQRQTHPMNTPSGSLRVAAEKPIPAALIDVSFDARLGERFHAQLSLTERAGRLEMTWVDPPSVMAKELWALRHRESSTVVLTDCDQDRLNQELPLAAWMVRYATDPACLHAHRWLTPGELRPLYVREKVAQTIEERQHTTDLQWSPMTERDIASVMVIENQAYPFPWSSGNFMDSLRAGYDMQVLKERGVMIGYLIWMRVLGEAHLLNIALSPARQRHGLGSWMMRQFIARLQGMGIDEVLLEVRPSNLSALGLYRKCGFAPIGVRKGYYPNNAQTSKADANAGAKADANAAVSTREDAIVMRLSLAQDARHRNAHAGHDAPAERLGHA